MLNKNHFVSFIVVILLISNIFFGVQYFLAQNKIHLLEKQVKLQQINAKILSFEKLFIDNVLKANTEVSFDQRLKLENAVRDLNDPDVLAEWEKFTSSTSEAGAQQEVKNLLSLLTSKISY
jgi:hypothetical protein